MLKRIIFLTALLTLAASVWAQPQSEFGTVSGQVTFSDGTVAASAQIFISPIPPELPHFAYTDQNGMFSIDSVSEGHHLAQASYLESEVDLRIEVETDELLTVNFVLDGPLDDTGSIAGNVLFANGTPVSGAFVHIDGGTPQHEGVHLATVADSMGVFFFSPVPVGPYEITAVRPMVAWVSDNIQVADGQTTNVTLFMRERHDSTGHHHHDSLTIIELAGRAIVLPGDSTHHRLPRFFIDVNDDTIPDYRLSFGPRWYNPPSGALRPNNRDLITIRGGLLTYTDPPVVVVYEINDMIWRPVGNGHGGNGGDQQYRRNGCNGNADESDIQSQQNPTVFQATGMILIPLCIPEPINPPGVFLFQDPRTDEYYNLNFGTDWVGIPGNASNPISIVGGLVEGTSQERPWVIIYELNQQFVREPGDTVGLAPVINAIDPIYVGTPTTYLTASNYPNPFNPITTISYSVPTTSLVKITIFDITGREISELVNANQTAGTYRVEWNGSHLSSGLYFYRISAGNLNYTNRMVLLK